MFNTWVLQPVRGYTAYDVFAELDESFQKLTSKKIRHFDFKPYLYTLE